MMVSRPARLALVAGFLALAAICRVQDAHAQLSIVWRGAMLSWDCPDTQAQDALAVQGITCADAARQLREHTSPALAPAGRLAKPVDAIPGDGVVLTSRLTRSPPVV